MYFPVAEIEVSPFVPAFAAFAISFFCSISGISGAFLLLPWQVSFLGYVAPGVSATNQIFNIVACPGGVVRYWREGRLLLPLTWIMASGTLPGVFIGAFVRLKYMSENKIFLPFAALVLFYLGFRLFLSGKKKIEARTGLVKTESFDAKKLSFTFANERYDVACPRLFILSLVVGLVGGIYGVGGGAIMSPFLISILGLPPAAIAGASLLSTFLTSIGGVISFAALSRALDMASGSPDWALGAIMGAGGFAGMYLGALSQKYIPGRVIKAGLGIIVIFTGSYYLYRYLSL